MPKRFLIGPPDVMAAHADWLDRAAEFPAKAMSPPVIGTSPAAAVIGGVYAQVAEGHAQFGTRLAGTALNVQQACFRFIECDEANAARVGAIEVPQ